MQVFIYVRCPNSCAERSRSIGTLLSRFFRVVTDTLEDTDLLSLFNKAQKLSSKQKETVKDFLSAFVLKADLTQKLAQ